MRVLPALLVLAACSPPPPTPPRTGPPLPCELRDYTITSVTAYVERTGKLGATRVRGAELFVQAQPDLTAEWLQLQLARHVEAARRATPTVDCPLDVLDPTITVQASGPGFIVRIRADNAEDGDEILRRARALGP